jgi:hypothetical protein
MLLIEVLIEVLKETKALLIEVLIESREAGEAGEAGEALLIRWLTDWLA